MQETLGLSIEGMHCGACVRRLTNALGSLRGVHIDSVEVGSAMVTFSPEQTTPERITHAVGQIGFIARVQIS